MDLILGVQAAKMELMETATKTLKITKDDALTIINSLQRDKLTQRRVQKLLEKLYAFLQEANSE